MTLICIWLLYDWWFTFRNDILPIFLKWYFEITFIPSKKDCADHPFESTFISSLGQHNRWKQFFMLLVLKWYMTFISKWAMRSYFHFETLYDCHFEMRGQNFRPQNYFRQESPRYFIDENASIITIFVHSFLRKAWSLSLRWNIFLKKGEGLLCQILKILQC